MKFYLDLPMSFSPGSAFDYKSLCDRLAGHVVEPQAQRTLPEFPAEHLFLPLGMKYFDWDGWNPVDTGTLSHGLKIIL